MLMLRMNRLTLTNCFTMIIPQTGSIVKRALRVALIALRIALGIVPRAYILSIIYSILCQPLLRFPLRQPDSALNLPEHSGGNLMGCLAYGHLRTPVVEEINVAQQCFGVYVIAHGQIQALTGDHVGTVRRERCKCVLGQLFVHVGHRAVHAGVMKVVLILSGNLRGGLHDGAVKREVGIGFIRLDLPAAGKRVFHDGALALLKMPNGRQAVPRRVDV